jgi:uncharacterized membrane protein YtjA (UPF0391 family)
LEQNNQFFGGVQEMADLLYLAVVFFVIALILGILGVRGAGISMDIAKWLIIVFIILAVLSLIFGGSFHMAVLQLVI